MIPFLSTLESFDGLVRLHVRMVSRINEHGNRQVSEVLVNQRLNVSPGETTNTGSQCGYCQARDVLRFDCMSESTQAVVHIGRACLAGPSTVRVLAFLSHQTKMRTPPTPPHIQISPGFGCDCAHSAESLSPLPAIFHARPEPILNQSDRWVQSHAQSLGRWIARCRRKLMNH